MVLSPQYHCSNSITHGGTLHWDYEAHHIIIKLNGYITFHKNPALRGDGLVIIINIIITTMIVVLQVKAKENGLAAAAQNGNGMQKPPRLELEGKR